AAHVLKQKNPSLILYASPVEAAWINGQEKPLRLQQAESIYACLPESQKPAAEAFQSYLESVKPVAVDCFLEEGCSWPLAAFVDIVATPGHTPGHISLYLKIEQMLLAGDAVVMQESMLELANPHYAISLPEAIASVEKLGRLPIQKLVCYHGGVMMQNTADAFAALLEKWKTPQQQVAVFAAGS
ncbi:MAG: MBL fold metallo-hydrolase, partial [Chitinophagaceae bacterium]